MLWYPGLGMRVVRGRPLLGWEVQGPVMVGIPVVVVALRNGRTRGTDLSLLRPGATTTTTTTTTTTITPTPTTVPIPVVLVTADPEKGAVWVVDTVAAMQTPRTIMPSQGSDLQLQVQDHRHRGVVAVEVVVVDIHPTIITEMKGLDEVAVVEMTGLAGIGIQEMVIGTAEVVGIGAKEEVVVVVGLGVAVDIMDMYNAAAVGIDLPPQRNALSLPVQDCTPASDGCYVIPHLPQRFAFHSVPPYFLIYVLSSEWIDSGCETVYNEMYS